tara:strand:- start:7510 stop:8682 length:1173 start_codon:yes stop_codon:yes gene_type:complete
MSTKTEAKGSLKMKKSIKAQVSNEPIKVDLTDISSQGELISNEVTKVIIPKQEDDAIQIGETKEVPVGKPSEDSTEMGEPVQESNETVEGFSPIKEVTEEEEKEVKPVVESKKIELPKIDLPENVEKLVEFMKDTGGTIEDYTRLNADYSTIDNDVLLKEYYKKAKPHLNDEEIGFVMEDNFSFDEEIDDERDIRKKKLAFKEEVAKAQNFLEDLKGKYYDEIKLRPGVTQEQKKATDFFNRFNENQEVMNKQHQDFKTKTKDYFSNEFKGFDFNVGEKKFRYGVKNPSEVAEIQSDITKFTKKFLDDKGNIQDEKGYHKAMYAARNADTIAQHFYEQGKADAVKNVIAKSKNISSDIRSTPNADLYIGGLKVKAVNGLDSTKLKIKTRK